MYETCIKNYKLTVLTEAALTFGNSILNAVLIVKVVDSSREISEFLSNYPFDTFQSDFQGENVKFDNVASLIIKSISLHVDVDLYKHVPFLFMSRFLVAIYLTTVNG